VKWLTYTVGALASVIVLALVVLLVLGARSDHRIAASVEIERPAEVVFTWITDSPRLQSWVGWLVDIRHETPHQQQVGARQVWVMEDRNNNNQHMSIAAEIVAYQPPRQLTARLSAPGLFSGTVDYTLEAVGAERTRLHYVMSYEYDLWLAKLLEPVIAMSAQQKLEDDLGRLKQRAEAERRGYAQGK
jgi:uncharacterized membrane protein